jgi:hypothetical protein
MVALPAGGDTPLRARVSALALMLGSGPRFARDAFGPVIVFYVAWKLIGLPTAILAATALAIAAYIFERRRARSGITAGLGLGIALVQAIAGLTAGSTTAYFAPPIIARGAFGLAFLVSVAIGHPLAGVFAQDTYPFPPQVKASHTFRRVFSRISLVWATYLAPDGTSILRPVAEQRRDLPGDQRPDGYSVHGRAHELVDLVQRAEFPTKRGVGSIPH